MEQGSSTARAPVQAGDAGSSPAPVAAETVCEICGKPNATVAYFRTGMTEVTYRHARCDQNHRELSAYERRQQWSIDQWLWGEC